jgi:hypothetical protein
VKRFFDALLGRTQSAPSRTESIFAMSTAQIALEAQLNLTPANECGITFRAVSSSFFEQATGEIRDILDISTRDTGTKYRIEVDTFQFKWVILEDDQFEDLITTMHLVSSTLSEHGFSDQLLAAVFRFNDRDGRAVYFFYNFKRGTFYPFVPQGKQKRDNATELRYANALRGELPIEEEMERWYPMWDLPF